MADNTTLHTTSIAQIKLSNFRNYTHTSFDVGSEPVVLTGKNGAGKTNILEAVSLLSSGRGLRHARMEEFDRYGQNGVTSHWGIAATIRTPYGQSTIGTGKNPNGTDKKRLIKIDGELQSSQASLGSMVSVCSLTPQMDRIFIDGTSARRHYIDRIVGQFFPEHSKHLAVIDHAKSERIKLLKEGEYDTTWVGVLEKRMAEHGVAIATARLEVVEQLQRAILEDDSPFPKATLQMKGSVEKNVHDMPALQAEQQLQKRLEGSRTKDAENGRTSEGIHRSDFVVIDVQKNMPAALCSTGEQKALLLGLTLAWVRAKSHWSGQVPLLLLDEVVAHLDQTKRAALIAAIQQLNAQTWMTGTETSFFEDFRGSARFLTVENCKILG